MEYVPVIMFENLKLQFCYFIEYFDYVYFVNMHIYMKPVQISYFEYDIRNCEPDRSDMRLQPNVSKIQYFVIVHVWYLVLFILVNDIKSNITYKGRI